MDNAISIERRSRALPRQTQVTIVGIIGGALALIVLLALLGSWLLGRSDNVGPQSAAAAPGTFRPTVEQWATIKLSSVASLTFRTESVTDGKIAINDDRTTAVFSPYSGRVTKLFAKAGDHVAQGAPLMAVAASEFVQGQNDLIAAMQGENSARAQLNLAIINEKRQHELFDAKAGALKDWEQAQADLAAAKANFHTAEIAFAAVRNRLRILGKSDADIAALESASDQKMNAEAIVYAPIAGTVTQRQVGLGQYINSASAGAANPVFSIGDLSSVWLVANVRESDVPAMRLGDPVEVRVLAYPGRTFKAKLTYVAAAVDPNTHRLPVRAEVDNADGTLKPEMFANFSIITGTESVAPAVPVEAIIYEGDTARVWIATADGGLALRTITQGRIDHGMVEVLDGIKPGERIVIAGSLFIDRASQAD